MVKFLFSVLLVLGATLFSSCTSFKTSNGFMSVREDEVAVPEPGRALILFQRDNARIAEWNAVNIWEITNREPQLVGLLHGKMKAARQVDPGEHDFMLAIVGRTQILRTNVKAGMTYFVQVNYSRGGMDGNAAYSFMPVRAGDENPMTAADVSYFNDNAKQWESESMISANNHMAKAFKQWEEYSPEQRARFSMLPTDGR